MVSHSLGCGCLWHSCVCSLFKPLLYIDHMVYKIATSHWQPKINWSIVSFIQKRLGPQCAGSRWRIWSTESVHTQLFHRKLHWVNQFESDEKSLNVHSLTGAVRTLDSLAWFKSGYLKKSSTIRVKNLTCSVCFPCLPLMPCPACTFHPCLGYKLRASTLCFDTLLWNHKAWLDLL